MVEESVRTGDRAKIVAAVCQAIESLENENFISKDSGLKQAEDMQGKIAAAKIPLKNQMQIDAAASKGSERLKDIEDRQRMPPPVRPVSRLPRAKPQPPAEPQPSTSRGYADMLKQIEATKANIKPRLERLSLPYQKMPGGRRVVTTANMINASLRSITTYQADRPVQLPLANELPSPRSSISEAAVRRRIEELKISREAGQRRQNLADQRMEGVPPPTRRLDDMTAEERVAAAARYRSVGEDIQKAGNRSKRG